MTLYTDIDVTVELGIIQQVAALSAEEIMSISIGKHQFEGPYTDLGKVRDEGGVYAILGLNQKQYQVIDIGQSSALRSRIGSHDRSAQWERQNLPLSVAVLYTPRWSEAERCVLEAEMRRTYQPPCGDR